MPEPIAEIASECLPVLFGLLCGASVGREGPTVQVGASIMLRSAASRRAGSRDCVVWFAPNEDQRCSHSRASGPRSTAAADFVQDCPARSSQHRTSDVPRRQEAERTYRRKDAFLISGALMRLTNRPCDTSGLDDGIARALKFMPLLRGDISWIPSS